MIRKLLIAATATAAIAAAASTQANAKVHFNVNVNAPGVYLGEPYPVYPTYDDGFDDSEDCGYKVIFKKHWNYSHTAYKIIKKKVWVCY
jgi:hypothetical protein